MSTPSAKITIQDIYFTYRDGTEALRNISLDIYDHEIFVLFGPSRSGKTTLLRLLNRLSDLFEGATARGTILFDGQNIFDHRVNVADLRRRISMVFAVPTPLPGSQCRSPWRSLSEKWVHTSRWPYCLSTFPGALPHKKSLGNAIVAPCC